MEEENLMTKELMTELVNNSRKQLFYARVRTLAMVIIAAAVILFLISMAPGLLKTVLHSKKLFCHSDRFRRIP